MSRFTGAILQDMADRVVEDAVKASGSNFLSNFDSVASELHDEILGENKGFIVANPSLFPKVSSVNVIIAEGDVRDVGLSEQSPVPQTVVDFDFVSVSPELTQKIVNLGVQSETIISMKEALKTNLIETFTAAGTPLRLILSWPEMRDYLPPEMVDKIDRDPDLLRSVVEVKAMLEAIQPQSNGKAQL